MEIFEKENIETAGQWNEVSRIRAIVYNSDYSVHLFSVIEDYSHCDCDCPRKFIIQKIELFGEADLSAVRDLISELQKKYSVEIKEKAVKENRDIIHEIIQKLSE